MDTLQAIRQRKSYRGHFKSDPVPRKDLRELLEAASVPPVKKLPFEERVWFNQYGNTE